VAVVILKMNRKSKGKRGVVEYLLNERAQEGTAVTLRGNPEVTRALIQSISRKHKYLSGGLMFAKDEYITDVQKQEIMDAFEALLFAGIDTDKYNILWVEHLDKERIELNFVVPRLELKSGNDLDLYTHRRDLPLFDMWKNGINVTYGLADPNDPKRTRTITERTKVSRGDGTIIANRKNLDETLHTLVQNRQIHSRDQMIELLEKSGYQITRKNEESISVKHPDIGKKALRLKGGIYSEAFTSAGGIESLSKARERRIEAYDNNAAQGETGRDRGVYQKYLQRRIDRHQRRYAKTRKTNSPEPQSTQKRDSNTLVEKNNYDDERRRVDDRVRELIAKNRRRREESLKRARERETELFRRIEEFNLQIQEHLSTAERKLYKNLEESRAGMETDLANDTKRIDAEIEQSDTKERSIAGRLRKLFEGINERVAGIKESIEGVVNEIRKMRLFKKASKHVSIERPTIKRTPWS